MLAHQMSSSDKNKHRAKRNAICDFDMLDSKSCFIATVANGIGVFDAEDSSAADDEMSSKVETRSLYDDGNSAFTCDSNIAKSIVCRFVFGWNGPRVSLTDALKK